MMADFKEAAEHTDRVEEHPMVIGADTEDIDKRYWLSPKFLGSCVAIILLGNGLFFGYAVPVRYKLSREGRGHTDKR